MDLVSREKKNPPFRRLLFYGFWFHHLKEPLSTTPLIFIKSNQIKSTPSFLLCFAKLAIYLACLL